MPLRRDCFPLRQRESVASAHSCPIKGPVVRLEMRPG